MTHDKWEVEDKPYRCLWRRASWAVYGTTEGTPYRSGKDGKAAKKSYSLRIGVRNMAADQIDQGPGYSRHLRFREMVPLLRQLCSDRIYSILFLVMDCQSSSRFPYVTCDVSAPYAERLAMEFSNDDVRVTGQLHRARYVHDRNRDGWPVLLDPSWRGRERELYVTYESGQKSHAVLHKVESSASDDDAFFS